MKYLVDIDLNKNQLLNAVVQNLATSPSSPSVGQIYFNTTDDDYYVYTAGGWKSLTEVYTHPVFTSLSPTLSGANVLATMNVNAEGHVTAATTRVLTLADLGFTGDPNANNYTHPSFSDPWSVTHPLTGVTVVDDITVNTEGHVTNISTRNLTAADLATVMINNAVSNTTQTWSGSKIQSELDAINSVITGALVYKGGYDASTNTPDLDVSPSGVTQGFTYTVTVGGTFYSESVQPGDMLIAEVTNPSTVADWTIVNKNIPDIVSASTTEQGIVELATNTETQTGSDTQRAITPAGLSSRTATTTRTGLIELATQTEVNTATDNTRAVTPLTMATYVNNAISGIIPVTTYSATVGNGSSTTLSVVHNFNTKDVMVEVYDTSNDNTVYTNVVRLDANTVNIVTNTAPLSNGLRVVVKK